MSGEEGGAGGLWGGRFSESPEGALDRLNRSLPVDWRLWPQELAIDRAWAAELHEAGVLDGEELEHTLSGLEAVERRFAAGRPDLERDEDVHSLVERWLEEEIGELAGQLHLGRSRNDLAATGTRLWGLDAVDRTRAAIRGVQEALIARADADRTSVLPGYSHLQAGQPSRAAAWLLAHFWALQRDAERLSDLRPRIARLPLGAAAGTGTTLPVDRERLAARLGFDGICPNSLDAVGARDWATELLFVWTQTAVDISRLAEDLVVFSSAEFGLVRIADGFSTGSSIMPQKRNPDGAELARAGAGVLLGLLTGLLATCKGLPSGYNKDLQEDKAALFRAAGELEDVLEAMRGTVVTLEIRWERGRELVAPALLATEIADWMARRGVPFRQAHRHVGRLVRLAEESDVALSELDREARAGIHPLLGELPAELWSVDAALERRSAAGGMSAAALEAQLGSARRILEDGAGIATRGRAGFADGRE